MSALGSSERFMGMEREVTLTCSTRTELCAVEAFGEMLTSQLSPEHSERGFVESKQMSVHLSFVSYFHGLSSVCVQRL